MKHIIIEGPDCCGKSYLIRTLLNTEKFKDYEVEHLSGRCPNTKEFHEDLLKYDRPMLFDRFFIGETIYPYIFNRPAKMNFSDVLDLCTKYTDKIVLIFIDADYDFIIKAYENKNEKFIYDNVRYEKKQFYHKYKILSNMEGLQIYRFKNYKENDIEFKNFIDKLIKEIN